MTENPGRPRILVFGAGAVGTLLGGVLTGAGYDVTLFGRGPSIDAIQDHGLSVVLHDRQYQTRPKAASLLEEVIEPFDVVILTVRSFAVAGTVTSLQTVLRHGGVLVTFQNGVGTEELITAELPEVDLVAASLTLSADAAEPGRVSSTSRSGGIGLAPVSAGAPVGMIATLFQASGIPLTTLDDYRSMKWSKLLLNQMANGIPAILDWTPGQLYRDPNVFSIEQAMLRETLQVIFADGARLVSLPGFPVPLLKWVLRLPAGITRRLLLRRVEGGRGTKLPSLLVDLQAGRRDIEARWLYGAVVEAGERLGVSTPVNKHVFRILDEISTTPDLRRTFQHQPQRLIDAVAST